MTFDIGYGYNIKGKLPIHGELSIGSTNHYINYIDNRFTGGGYHMIEKREIIIGIGGNIGYKFSGNIEIHTGYNTKRKLSFGMRLSF